MIFMRKKRTKRERGKEMKKERRERHSSDRCLCCWQGISTLSDKSEPKSPLCLGYASVGN
jgi:hypothetical protein